ncbi:uncharacterized protein LOC131668699 isoform X2 [Phymastichus coffea]|uniref:uncharacterized protein LOC131668699 isoform X2 n=1 Tax=Phymastichus coffea TaxID=108790 RepID=UPI00273AD1D8|nr:uncharacterized protein LOC131668699 isoform X2 [Phymastichus coffea]
MDGLPSHTRGINDSIPIPGQNCSTLLTLITTPSWESVNHDLRWHFLLHTYTFACLFFVLSFYTFFSFLNLRSLMSRPPFMSTINIFLCLLGALRCACLLIDPYNLKETMPLVIGSIIWDIGFPFITSAFCLIQLAFLQLTQCVCLCSQVKFGLERFQKETYLSLMIIFHISCVIISDVTLAFHVSYMSKYVVQMVFLIWALMLYVSFLYAGYKVKALLDTLPSNLLAREGSGANQKGIMQLAMLAPYNNLATSVAAALVPTLLGPTKFKPSVDDATAKPTAKGPENNNPSFNSNQQQQSQQQRQGNGKSLTSRLKSPPTTAILLGNDEEVEDMQQQPAISTVPEVYVRPPTPTPSIANLPIITVSSPSRRSSLASRRGSDVSQTRNSRRASECSVRFVNEDEAISANDQASPGAGKRSPAEPNSPSLDDRQPEGILRRNSDCITSQGSSRDLRRGSDVSGGETKIRSQFANKLRRNSDFGNRTPRRAQPEESKLAKILDISPSGSRRNSDLGSLAPSRAVESRRNSDVGRSAERRGSDIGFMKAQPSGASRRSSDVSIRILERSPLHHPTSPTNKTSEGTTKLTENEQADDKSALVDGTSTSEEQSPGKTGKKNLSWKSDSVKEEHHEDITAETSLLPDGQQPRGATGADFTLHSILNHIAYVNRAKSDSPLYIPEAATAAARRAQIKRVLNVTYTTAVLGILLCLLDVGRIFGPYGLLAETMRYGTKPLVWQFPKPWPWIIYQTLCRFLELVMGCAMASITKQPSASPRHQYLSSYPSYNLRMKQRDNLYI